LAGALGSFAIYKSLQYITRQEIQNSIPCCVAAPSCCLQARYSALCPHLLTFDDIFNVEEPIVYCRRLKPTREKASKENGKPEQLQIYLAGVFFYFLVYLIYGSSSYYKSKLISNWNYFISFNHRHICLQCYS